MTPTKILLFCSLIFCLTFSCKDKQTIEEFPVEFGHEYFPLAVGKYITYQVDSIIYNIKSTGTIDTTTFFLKEEITDTLMDNEGRVNYRLERSTRSNETDAWEIKDIWVALRTENKAERIEENLRFVKMVFPLKEGSTWDGNQFVDKETIISVSGETLEIFKGWSSEVESHAVAELINETVIADVTTIYHAENENLIEFRESIEKYAKDIGLIYKKMRILDTQIIDEFQPWEEKAEEGFILEYRLIDFN